MKYAWVFILCCTFFQVSASEWQSLKEYQRQTGRLELTHSDWLKSDRKKNSQVWQHANNFNLENQLPQEYQTIMQRRDFYEWYYKSMEAKGHEVIWPKMAHYISKKLRLTKAFPFSLFTKKSVKEYAYQGSEKVFNSAFLKLKAIYNSSPVLNDIAATEWDKEILYLEQYHWLQEIYADIDAETLKTIKRMSQGKGFYALLVPSEIRFKGNITDAKTRYEYALGTLRDYCKAHYE
ncbi:Insecticidal toxin complex protein [Hanstruepera neustonica]|uniref:Insecticidal toxin complex protein n=1 Tax=Hanstruepera neustonica TaxID=1445657 RepID=A0A2K1DW55_9FLAO|nr:Insecticidal toxin complex protein [Hanstruepera neustonica]PNQ72262.1 Insecticidal toxin complex protein [Hanstruepera neustonica]